MSDDQSAVEQFSEILDQMQMTAWADALAADVATAERVTEPDHLPEDPNG